MILWDLFFGYRVAMIFLFVADTGASMNQMASHGMTLLDCVKASIEYFVKLRGNRGDAFYLVDCAEGLSAVKSYKTNVASFLNELKNLEAVHISNIGPALKTSFDLVNLFRVQNSSDTYGVGRYTWFVFNVPISTELMYHAGYPNQLWLFHYPMVA